MARVQINPLSAPEVRPVAAPVDRFAQTDKGAQVSQLADALKGLAPELAQYGSTVFQQDKEADTAAGAAKANEVYADIQETGRQVKAGEIAPHESKWFRAAAEEQMGRLHAATFGSTLKAAMEDPTGSLAQSTDPADFDAFAKEQLAAYKATVGDGKFFDRSFLAGANQETLQARDRFASQAGARLEKQVIEGTYIEHQQNIEAGLRSGASMEEIAKTIYARNTIQYALNPKAGAALSNTMIRSVIDYAQRTENLQVLDILDYVPGGAKGSMLSKTSLANKLIPEAIQSIRAARQQRYNLANTEDRQATKDAVEDSIGGLYEAMDKASDEGKTLTADEVKVFADQVSAVDPTQTERVYRTFQADKKRTDVDDEAIAGGLWQKAFRGSLNYDDVAAAYEHDSLTEETSRKLRTEIRRNKQGKGAAKALTQEPRLTETKTRLRNLFIDQYGVNKTEMKVRAEFAVQDLENAWVNYRRGEGAGADDATVNQWLHDAVTRHFINRADSDLRSAFKGAMVPPAGTMFPTPIPWEKGKVVDPPFLGTLSAEIEKFHKTPNYRFPPAVEEVLRRNHIKNIAEAEDFLKKQRSFAPSN